MHTLRSSDLAPPRRTKSVFRSLDRSADPFFPFVRIDRFQYIENIHWSKTTNGMIEVAEHGDLIHTWMYTPISHDIWALHHYATKSREDYHLKKGGHRYVHTPRMIFFLFFFSSSQPTDAIFSVQSRRRQSYRLVVG